VCRHEEMLDYGRDRLAADHVIDYHAGKISGKVGRRYEPESWGCEMPIIRFSITGVH